MTLDETAPPGVDINRPSIARVYDYMLGGKDNFAVDRAAGQRALEITPDGPEAARASRAFLRRVVRYLAGEVGIRQFLDLGSGLPSQGNVHEIAHLVDPTIRVIYVDNDPMVLAHGRALLCDNDTTNVIQADVRHPEAILGDPTVRERLDFDRPIGLLMLGILHHVNDDEAPARIAATMRDALPPGSYLAISHFRDPGFAHPEVSAKARDVERVFNQTLGTGRWRQQEEILAYFGDLPLVDPGLVPLADWRPDTEERPDQTDTYLTFVGGVARKP
ncbi:MAG TPA: SAM-dependent methyltransferase [Rugosimonospora sp.]|nr:SAM-dependent methyltransferase [Rugosimonospora sp.]